MKFDAKTTSSLTDLAQTAFALAFLTAWLICCLAVAFLSRIYGLSDLLSKKFFSRNNTQNHGSYIRHYFKKQLLKSKTILTDVPKALGI